MPVRTAGHRRVARRGLCRFGDDIQWALLDHDAVPRARVPHRAEFPAPGMAGKRLVDEAISECREEGGLVIQIMMKI